MKRRVFLKSLAASGILTSTYFFSSCINDKKKLKILVLGGTNFVGPSIVIAALQNNYEVTLFNRGITNPNLFPELKHIKGDRESGVENYKALVHEKWDVIIDVWPEKSKLVEESTSALKNKTKHYIFISSIAVYNNFQEVGLHEKSKTVNLDLSKEKWEYPEEKLAAENIVQKRFPKNHTILRPGPIKGYRDSALDLLYWCLKLSKNESVIAPGSGNDPLQFIDVNDVGRFCSLAIDKKLNGIYNVVGPQQTPLLWNDFLNLAKKHLNSQSELIWANEDFLKENKVYSFSDLPLWAPLSEDRGFMQISNKKVIDAGFQYTPVANTLDDCMKWYNQNNKGEIKFGAPDVGVGLDRARELKLIESLKG